ncbi:FkbM family methyltransferase [Chryseobacterium sp.]|uniref:FkbM family methyltransferase n=1 Tax=Chryseobacterium sp. TaxID=1871047 RepID=UPI003890B2C4
MRTMSGDIDIFYEIFWKKVYHIPQKYKKDYKVIVDLGGHIGFTALYFSTIYPKSTIYTVEASQQNYHILKKNISPTASIKSYHAAIYPTDGFINFETADLSYNCKIGKFGKPTKAMSVKTLMEENNLDSIDLLKIDIEGAEKQLLSQHCDWLEKVDQLIIEIHEGYSVQDLQRDLGHYHFKIIVPDETSGGFQKHICMENNILI